VILLVLVGLGACAVYVVGRTLRARARWRHVLAAPTAPRPRNGVALVERVQALVQRPWLAGVLAVLGVAAGGVLGGPVAAGLAGAYAAAGGVLVRRRWAAARFRRERVAAVDVVSTLAAELRAGLPAPVALASAHAELGSHSAPGTQRGAHSAELGGHHCRHAGSGRRCGARADVGGRGGGDAVAARLASAVALAESSGAPLADVLDRLDSHLRAMDRARRGAQAQAAGAMASAALLAVLPVAGVGLGYLVGVDPAQVLLHTALGAGCLGTAVALQLAGLAWADRLSRVEVPA
jgi:tight adherence protein B